MKASSTRHVAVLAAALLGALAPVPASAVLERVGPNNPTNYLPEWYQDTTGLTFEFCTPLTQAELDGGWCLLLPGDTVVPEVFPGAFSGEHFYWASDVLGDWSYVPPVGVTVPFNTGKVVFVQAIEAAFLGAIGPGLGGVFGRVRIRVLDVPLTGTYKFYTPWGIKLIDGVAGGRIFDTEDIGINCAPFQYDCALQTSIGPFLVPSTTPGGPELPPVVGPGGKLYLSDPATPPGPVTGSPMVGDYTLGDGTTANPNVFAIEAPDGQVIFRSHDFSTMGRIFTDVIPSRITADRASYARDGGGAIRVDAFATGEPTVHPRLPADPPTVPTQPVLNVFAAPCGGTVSPTGDILPPYTAPVGETATNMARNVHLYWQSVVPALVPAGVCIEDQNAVNAGGAIVPTYTPGTLTDQVFLTAAVFDPTDGGSLSVRASSSDEAAPPILSLGAFGDLAANVPLDNNLAYVAPLTAPPAKVRVYSQEGGSAELLVKVGSRAASGVTLTADLTSPQVPGTAVIFTAQGAGAAEYLYRFWLDTGSGFGTTPVQDWSTNPHWALPGTTAPGHYRVVADVWAGLQPTAPDATSNIVVLDIRQPPATGVTLTADRTSPATIGFSPPATVFSAAGEGSPAPYEYRFLLSTNGGAFNVVQNYGIGFTWTMPAITPAGSYVVRVDVRTSSTVDLDASSTLPFQLVNAPPATSSLLTATPAASGVAGSASFSATCSGSTSPCDFQFQAFNGTAWSVVQAWGNGPTWTVPANFALGTYSVVAEARTSALVPRDVYSNAISGYLVRDAVPASAATLTATPAGSGAAGSAVFSAACSGTSSPCDFQFQAFNGTAWTVVQPWGNGATWTVPAAFALGTYTVLAEARTSSLVARDVYSNVISGYVVKANVIPATSATLAANPIGSGVAGAATFTAACVGTTSPCSYQFQAFNGATWTVVRAWGTGNTWTVPVGMVPGTYAVVVEVRTSSLVARDAWSNVISGYVIRDTAPATSATLSVAPAGSGTAGAVSFSASCAGASSPCDFQFQAFNGSAWTVVQPWGGGAAWSVPAGFAPGTYTVVAEARTSSLVARDVYSNVISGYVIQ